MIFRLRLKVHHSVLCYWETGVILFAFSGEQDMKKMILSLLLLGIGGPLFAQTTPVAVKPDGAVVKTVNLKSSGETPEETCQLGLKYKSNNEPQKAFACFQKAAELGHAEAQYWLGFCYANGFGVAKNLENAFKWLQKSADQGNADAQCGIAWCYENGIGVPQDPEKASVWYQKSANQSNANAQFIIGLCYANGLIVAPNREKAFEWYQKSANQGNADAQNRVGLCYKEGLGVAKDPEKAFEWYQKSANQGVAIAQCAVGFCYAMGLGVAQNSTKAFVWFCKSAEQGYADGQLILGICYEYGKGVNKDFQQAVLWYYKAAAQEKAEAQYRLGLCYKNGLGVGRDFTQAISWLGKATAQGHTAAKKEYQELLKVQKEQSRKQDAKERSWIESEGLAWARLLTSPLDVFSPMSMTYYSVYRDNIFIGIIATPFIPVATLLPGVVMFVGDVLLAPIEMLAGSNLATSHFPWECFDCEITDRLISFFWKSGGLATLAKASIRGDTSRLKNPSYSVPSYSVPSYSVPSYSVPSSNPYGPHINQYGQPVQYQPAFGGVPGEQLQIKQNVYAPGIHEDQYGRPVYERPAF